MSDKSETATKPDDVKAERTPLTLEKEFVILAKLLFGAADPFPAELTKAQQKRLLDISVEHKASLLSAITLLTGSTDAIAGIHDIKRLRVIADACEAQIIKVHEDEDRLKNESASKAKKIEELKALVEKGVMTEDEVKLITETLNLA